VLDSASLAYLFACWKICQWDWNEPKTCVSVLFWTVRRAFYKYHIWFQW